MALLKLEGNYEDVSDKQIQYIKDVIENRGFKNNRVLFTNFGQAGDNFASGVKRITVIGDDGHDFCMIVKIAPTVEIFRSVMNITSFFRNEITVYTELLPIFKSLETSANVPNEERLPHAECYGFILEEPHELILLEDLKLSDYVMLDKFTSLNHDHVKLSLKNLAIFNGLSYAARILYPDKYNVIKNKLVNVAAVVRSRDDAEVILLNVEDSFLNILTDEKYKRYVRGSVIGMKELDVTLIPSKINEYSVIQHGDVWSNNILFKYKDNDVKECIMIDYQMSSENNPASDILALIFSCTSHVEKIKHFDDWLDHYYQQLNKTLGFFQLEAKDIYPKQQLLQDIKTFAKFQLGHYVMALMLIYRNPEEAAAMKEVMAASDDVDNLEDAIDVAHMSAKTLSLCKNRIEDLLDSCFELELNI